MPDVNHPPDRGIGTAGARFRTLVDDAYGRHRRGEAAEAIGLAMQAAPLWARDDLAVDSDTAWSLNSLGIIFFDNGYARQAQEVYGRALAMIERLGSPDDEMLASVANNLGQAEARLGHYERAVTLLERAVHLRDDGSTGSLVLGFSIDNLGGVCGVLGDLDRAETMHRRALGIFMQHGGPFDEHVATALGNLSLVYLKRGDLDRAEAYRLRACDAHERQLGLTHPETLLDLRYLAEIHRKQGDEARADRFVDLLLSIDGGAPVQTQRFLAEMLDSLAQGAVQDFQLDLAEMLGARSAELLAGIEGPNAPETLGAVHRLGTIQHATGDLLSAQKSLRTALSGYEALGRTGEAAQVLVDLGKVYRQWNQFPIAVEMFTAAANRLRQDPGSDRRKLASALGNLAELHYQSEELDEAETTYAEALAALGAGELDGERAWLLHNQAMLRYHRGQHAEARGLYEEAKRIWADAFGDDHPFVATASANLALLHWATGDARMALDAFTETNAIRDREMRRVLAVGSERKRAAYARALQDDLYKVVSFFFQAGGALPDAARFAAEQMLQRKGCVLEAVASTFARLYEGVDAGERRSFERLNAVRSEITELIAPTLVLRTPIAEPDRLAALRDEEERLEAALSYRTALDRPGTETITLDAVQRAIPADVAVVDFLRFPVFDPVRTGRGSPWRETRYAALVLRAAGEPRWFDLGPAEAVDSSLDRLRSLLRRRSSTATEWESEASELYSLVVAPLHHELRGARQLLLSPDGKLTLMPLGLLRDRRGKSLSPRFTVSYLSSGRDVVRAGGRAASARGVVVVAAPDFEAVVTEAGPQATDRFADRGAFVPLAGTHEEGEDLAALLADVTLLMEEDATVGAMKAVCRPAVLHVATHGIFRPMHEPELHWAPPELLRIGDQSMLLQQSEPVIENPMFFSGLALAGANGHGIGVGILTAQEIAGLNLRGTELVVLSACETGLGTVKDGEEFAGLRRALAIAGAATQVTSLWRVDDQATRVLMGHYYRQLLKGQGRAKALASAQKRIASDAAHPEWQHPFYWAAFVSAGAWAPMGGCISRRR